MIYIGIIACHITPYSSILFLCYPVESLAELFAPVASYSRWLLKNTIPVTNNINRLQVLLKPTNNNTPHRSLKAILRRKVMSSMNNLKIRAIHLLLATRPMIIISPPPMARTLTTKKTFKKLSRSQSRNTTTSGLVSWYACAPFEFYSL